MTDGSGATDNAALTGEPDATDEAPGKSTAAELVGVSDVDVDAGLDDGDGADDDDGDDNEQAVLAAREHVGRLLGLRAITTVIHVDDDHPATGESPSDPVEVITALNDAVVTIEYLANNDATRDIVTGPDGELTSAQALASRITLAPEEFTTEAMAALTDAARLAARSRAAGADGVDTGDSVPAAAAANEVDTEAPAEQADADTADTGRAIPEREATDIEAQTEIRRLIPDGIVYRPITLGQWNEEKEDLLASTDPVLILFDRDFHLEGEPSDLGESLLAEVINRNNDKIYCGMLTHGAVSDTTEREVVTRIAERSGSDVDVVDIVVIAKSAIVSQPARFPTKLKAVLLARQVRAVRARVLEIYSEAGRHASSEVEKLDSYTFSELIVAADAEGTHGVHNVLRVAATKQRIATQRALWPDEDVNSALGEIRLIHDAEREQNPLPATDISELRREDRYDTREYLADLHLPLEPGDIFEKVATSVVLNGATHANNGKRYILLMQPCDIAVRKSGGRTGEPKTFTLALLKRIPGKKVHTHDHILDWYDPADDGKVWCVQMWDRVQIPVRALEACMFGDDGNAVVKVGQEPPNTLTPGWRKRFEDLQAWADKQLTTYTKMTASNPGDDVVKLLTESLTGTSDELVDIKASFDTKGGRIGFGLRRIGRASNDDARLILANAGNYTARPGREGNLFPSPGVEAPSP